MNMVLKLLLGASTACYLVSSPVSAMDGPEEDLPAVQIPKQIIHPHLSYDAFKKQAMSKYPRDFEEFSPAYQTAIMSYRWAHANYKGTVYEAFFGLHNPEFVPIAQEMGMFLRGYLNENPSHRFTQRLIRELKNHREDQELSPYFLWGLPFRHAASRSVIGGPEADLFRHFPYPNIFFVPLENEAWRNSASTFLSLDPYGEEGFNSFLPPSVVDKIVDRMTRLLPVSISAPLLGKGKLSPSFLVENYLHHVFPVGIPMEELTGHGIPLSSYGFGVHDRLHEKVDLRYYYLISHVLERGFAHFAKGGDVHDFMDVYPQVACQRYEVLMGALNEIHENLVTKVLLRRGLREYRKAMVGFFWVMHEATYSPNFPSKLYDMNDLEASLKVITGSTVFDEEALDDPFQTSPLTGESRMTDEQIIQWVCEDEDLSREHTFHPFVMSAVVERGTQFIGVTLKLSTGEEQQHSYPTLYYKWNEIEDNLGLLRWGGTTLEKPDLTTVDNPRDVAIETLTQVQQAIAGHVNHFQKVALFFESYDPLGDGNTLGERYFKKHFNQEQRLKKQLVQGVLPDQHGRQPGQLNYGNELSDAQLPDQYGRYSWQANYGADLADDQLPDQQGRQPGEFNYGELLANNFLNDKLGRYPGKFNYGNDLPDDQLPDQHGRQPGEFNYGELLADNMLKDKHGRYPGALNYGNDLPDDQLNN